MNIVGQQYGSYDPLVAQFFNFFDLPKPKKKKSISFMKTLSDKVSAANLAKTNELLVQAELAKKSLVEKKVSLEHIDRTLPLLDKAIKTSKEFIDILNSYNVDDFVAKEIVANASKIFSHLEEIKSILKSYKEIDEARKEVEEGETLTHEELLNAL